jgi:hypothetical protein
MSDSIVPYGRNNGQVTNNYGENMSDMEKINAMLQFVSQIGNGMESLRAFCEQNADKVGFLYQLTEKEIGALRAEWGADSLEIKQWMNQVAVRIQGAEQSAAENHGEVEVLATRFSTLYEAQQEALQQQAAINAGLTSTLNTTVKVFGTKTADLAGNIESIRTENKKKTVELKNFRATLRADLSARPTFEAVTEFVNDTFKATTEGLVGMLEEAKETLGEEVEETREKIIEIKKGIQEAKELEKRIDAFEQLIRVGKKENVEDRKMFERRLKECNSELSTVKEKTLYLAKRLSQERTDASGKEEEIMSRVEELVGVVVDEKLHHFSKEMMARLEESQRHNNEGLASAMKAQEKMMEAFMKKMSEQIKDNYQKERSPIPNNPNLSEGFFTTNFNATLNNEMPQVFTQKTKDQRA